MFSFFGGIHPAAHKDSTHAKRIESAPIPHRVLIPFCQHTGIPSEPNIKVGDLVKVGTKIGEADGKISVPTHATISGKVTEIKEYPHPVMSQRVLTCVIESDGKDIWEESIKRNPIDFDTNTLINLIAEAGIVGLGGSAFPTHVKVAPLEEKPIETLIINCCECEPYLTADHQVILENAAEIIEGAKLIAKIINPKRIIIVIEENQPEAIAKMEQAITKYDNPISVITVKTKYPQGAEKQLIKTVLGIQVPSGGLPIDVKALVQNVQTCYAVYEAVTFHKPLVEKVITVTGQVKEPKNLRVRIGTPILDLVNFCGGYSEEPKKVILGGPMMGIAQFNDELPIIKSTLGVLILSDKDVKIFDEQPCIRCARCVNACPMNLLPCTINDFVRHKNLDRAQEYNLFDCIECGCCDYVCPSQIKLVHAFQFAKNEILLKVKQ